VIFLDHLTRYRGAANDSRCATAHLRNARVRWAASSLDAAPFGYECTESQTALARGDPLRCTETQDDCSCGEPASQPRRAQLVPSSTSDFSVGCRPPLPFNLLAPRILPLSHETHSPAAGGRHRLRPGAGVVDAGARHAGQIHRPEVVPSPDGTRAAWTQTQAILEPERRVGQR
jgi:hypothetical protein